MSDNEVASNAEDNASANATQKDTIEASEPGEAKEANEADDAERSVDEDGRSEATKLRRS